MCKDKNYNGNSKPLREKFKVIFNKSYFMILESHRGVNYRKPLFDKLNKLFPPGKKYNTWKNYFLYPDTAIPENGKEMYLSAMSETLNLQIQIIEDDFTERLGEINKEESTIKSSLSKISEFRNIYENGKK